MFCAWSQNTQCFLLQKKISLCFTNEHFYLFFPREIFFSSYFFSHQTANHQHGRENNFDQTKKVNHQKKNVIVSWSQGFRSLTRKKNY